MSLTDTVHTRTNLAARLGTSAPHVVTLMGRGLLVLTGAAGALIATLTPAVAPRHVVTP